MSYLATAQAFQQTETALQYLIEVTKRKKAATTLVAPIQALDTQLGILFIRQGNALVRALAPLKKVLQEDAITKQFDAIFNDATQATSIDMLAALEKSYKDALLLGGTQQLVEVGIKISFKLDNPRAAAYIADYGADQISGIDENTRSDMRNLLEAAIKNGTSYTELAQAIKARYKHYAVGVPQQHIRSRAELIAVTEIGNGYAAGNYASMQTVQDTGIKMQKRWLTVGDTRVSDGCRNNQAQSWIDLNKEHISGHLHPLRFPGCRCVEQYQRDASASKAVVAKPAPVAQAKPKPAKFVPYEFNATNAASVNNDLSDLYPETSSFWDKKVNHVSMRAMGLYDPNNGKLSLSTTYAGKDVQDEKFKGLIHELLHSRSKGTRDFNLEGLGWEEAIVEGNAQISAKTIAKNVKYTFVDETKFEKDFKLHPYYEKWIKPLDAAVDELGLDREKFYKDMLAKTCDQRKEYIRAAYKKKYPKGNDAREKMLALNKALQ